MNQQQVDKFMANMQTLKDRATAKPGQLVRFCAGMYYLHNGESLWEIKHHEEIAGAYKWVASADRDTYNDPMPTLRECKEQVMAATEVGRSVNRTDFAARTIRLAAHATNNPGRPIRFDAGYYMLHNGISLWDIYRDTDGAWVAEEFNNYGEIHAPVRTRRAAVSAVLAAGSLPKKDGG